MKKITTLLLSLCLFASMLVTLAVPAFAAEEPEMIPEPPTISNLRIVYSENGDQLALFFDMQYSESMNNAIDYYENHESGYNQVGYISGIGGQYAVDGGEWQDIGISSDGEGGFQTFWADDIKIDSYVQLRVKASGWDVRWDGFETEWSNVLKLNEPASVIEPITGDNPTDAPTEALTEASTDQSGTSIEKTKCKVCGICPIQPLGICLFIWIAAILVIVLVVAVIVLTANKKKDKENRQK